MNFMFQKIKIIVTHYVTRFWCNIIKYRVHGITEFSNVTICGSKENIKVCVLFIYFNVSDIITEPQMYFVRDVLLDFVDKVLFVQGIKNMWSGRRTRFGPAS